MTIIPRQALNESRQKCLLGEDIERNQNFGFEIRLSTIADWNKYLAKDLAEDVLDVTLTLLISYHYSRN